MADVAAPPEQDAVGDLDFLSDLYLDFDGYGGFDLFTDTSTVLDPCPPLDGASAALPPTQMMGEIERFLMMEEGGRAGGAKDQPLADDFFTDVLFAGSEEGSVRSAVSDGDAAGTPEEESAEGSDGGKEMGAGELEPEANAAASAVEREKDGHGDESDGKGGEDDLDEDPLRKKQIRQMRNRDSAMKSRERKKMYVRDLEIKSKFLESECRRLQHALHCCATENMVLRQCLQKAKVLGAPLAKQESAVLFVESLLLGSLFWLVSIVCLFLMPSWPVEVIENPCEPARSRTQIIKTKGPESERPGPGLGSEFIYKRRRCKALRTKMKICLFPLDVVSW